MPSIAGFSEFEYGPPSDHLAPMAQEGFENFLEVQQPRLVLDQRDHVHAERVLHLRFFVQIVQDDFRHFAALEFQYEPHTLLVGLVPKIGNAFDLLLADQLADALQHLVADDLVRQLINDNRLAVAFFQFLYMGACTNDDAASSATVSFLDADGAVDNPLGREVRSGDNFDDLFQGDIRTLEDGQTGIDDLGQVVGRHIGGHAHGNTRRTIDQQIRDPGRQDARFLFLAVVIGDEVDCLLVDIGKEFGRNFFQPAFGIAVRGG